MKEIRDAAFFVADLDSLRLTLFPDHREDLDVRKI
jgi:hypothetical protein